MRGTVLYGPGNIRFEESETPKIIEATDAVIRTAATCVCGSDLWPYRGLQPIKGPTPMGHEYCGFVEEVGSAVKSVKPGQFVIGSFATSDNTCPHCQHGYQSSCMHREFITRAQAPLLRVPLADGTLVPTPGVPSDGLVPSLLTTSDVLGTGWFAADAANVRTWPPWASHEKTVVPLLMRADVAAPTKSRPAPQPESNRLVCRPCQTKGLAIDFQIRERRI
jgi:threonine dehydrogenase-like Zn-dependent dehydrogenase